MKASDIVALAKKEVGYKEGTNNDTKYGVWYGLNHNPWCAMFVSYVFHEAGLTSLIAQSPKGYAGCEIFEAWAKDHHLIVPTNSVQAGDILLFDFAKSGKAEHTGIAISGIDPHTHLVSSIEGNTGADHVGVNQANGDGVYQKVRAMTTVRAVIRPKYTN